VRRTLGGRHSCPCWLLPLRCQSYTLCAMLYVALCAWGRDVSLLWRMGCNTAQPDQLLSGGDCLLLLLPLLALLVVPISPVCALRVAGRGGGAAKACRHLARCKRCPECSSEALDTLRTLISFSQ
jgi:hypothetical protein